LAGSLRRFTGSVAQPGWPALDPDADRVGGGGSSETPPDLAGAIRGAQSGESGWPDGGLVWGYSAAAENQRREDRGSGSARLGASAGTSASAAGVRVHGT